MSWRTWIGLPKLPIAGARRRWNPSAREGRSTPAGRTDSKFLAPLFVRGLEKRQVLRARSHPWYMTKPNVRFVYSGIRVRNLERSITFYRKLGFRVLWRGTMEHGGEWVRMAQPRQRRQIELNYYPRGTRYYSRLGHAPEFDHFGVYVGDFDRWYRDLRKAGARVLIRPFTHSSSTFGSSSRIAFLLDPDGFPIEIWSDWPNRRR